MTSRWLDTVTALAGRRGRLSEGPDPEQKGVVEARLDVPGARFRIPGPTSEDAWRTVAFELGHVRLLQALETSDWTGVDEFTDEVQFLVAQDPAGRVWAIGVASEDSYRSGYLDAWVAMDGRAAWVAFVEPIETRDWGALRSAIARRGRPIRGA